MERAYRMDAFLKKIGELADLAAREAAPAPLDASLVMARIGDMRPEIEDEMALPFALFAGVGMAAAAAAVLVFFLAASAWLDVESTHAAVESFIDVLEISL